MRIRTVQAGLERAVRFFNCFSIKRAFPKPELSLLRRTGKNDVGEGLYFQPGGPI